MLVGFRRKVTKKSLDGRLTVLEDEISWPVQRKSSVLGKLEAEEDGEDTQDSSRVESGRKEVAVL